MKQRRFYPPEMLEPSPANIKYTIYADGEGRYYLHFGEWLPTAPGRIILRHSELTRAAYDDFTSQYYICLYWWEHNCYYTIENNYNYLYHNKDVHIYNVPIVARLLPNASGEWSGARIIEIWEEVPNV